MNAPELLSLDPHFNKTTSDADLLALWRSLPTPDGWQMNDLIVQFGRLVQAKSIKPQKCSHPSTFPSYDHVTCTECGAVHTDSGWGIAKFMWFKSLDEARFYKDKGYLPTQPIHAGENQ